MQNTTTITENEILSEKIHELITGKLKNMNVKSWLFTKDQFDILRKVLVDGNEEHKLSVYATVRKSAKPSSINWFDWGVVIDGKKSS